MTGANKFQFQNGAVKSSTGFSELDALTKFQFQNGAVKRTYDAATEKREKGFNSKMVRLRDFVFPCNDCSFCVSIPKWCG